jgi:tetratricopeptide (TPR) repeat protein/outer membrane protein assembly factor BamB
MGFKGSVESFSLADVFQNLAMNQQTGALHVFTGTEEKFVYFQNGAVRFLSHGANQQLLTPQIFHARGLINVLQLESALQRQRESNEPASAALMGLGYVNEQQFNEVFKLQLEEEIYDLFGWEKANFEFNEGAPVDNLYQGQTAGKGPSLPISHLIMEAARRVDEWDRLKKQLPSFKEIYCMDLAARKAIESGEMETDPVEKRVATMIDCARDVDDVIADSHLFKFEVLNALAGFIQSSLVRPATVAELTKSEQDCMRLDLPKRRIKVLERVLALGGENSRIRKELAESLAKDEQIEKACIHFLVLAETELQSGKKDAAVDLYRRVLTLSPKHTKAHEQLAGIYAKDGKKREAFVHYQELFETFRDQNHLPQARAAAAAAVECDPSHTDLRNNLIELLLADNQKDAAGHQLELMGDQAAKSGNVKVAVDAYRRAMHLRPNNKALKKKLADVMLTKEDRLARKRKALLGLVALIVAGLSVGAVALKEHLNSRMFADADVLARAMVADAQQDEQAKRFNEARTKYLNAAQVYVPVTKTFSPVLNYHTKAAAQVTQLNAKAQDAEGNASKYREELARKAEISRENADNAMKNKRLMEALELYDSVISNEAASEKAKSAALTGKADAQRLIDKLQQGKQKLGQNPNQAFPSVDDEWGYKIALINDFRGYSDFKVSDVEMPVFIRPNTDGVLVALDNRPMGAVNSGGTREANTFRFGAGEAHKFEFKKPGFKTVSLTTSDLRTPTYLLMMEREPIVRVDLRSLLSPDVMISGELVESDGTLYIGTTDGSVLQIQHVDQRPQVLEFKPPATGALNNDVNGPVFIRKRAGKPPMLVYATKGGDSFGVEASGEAFKLVWHVKNTGRDMTAAPGILRLPLLANTDILALPVEKKLVLIDCEQGLPIAGGSVDFKEAISSAPLGLEQDSTVVVGCKDGRLRGMSLKNQTSREWNASSDAVALRGKPVLNDGVMAAGGDDGNVYLFTLAKNYPDKVTFDNAGAIVCEPLIIKKRVYVGTIDKEGFWCGELSTRSRLWKLAVNDLGDIRHRAVPLNDSIYFGTDRGKLFSVEADRGIVRWAYQIESNKPVIGPPLIIGKRVYCVSKDGKLLGFDE